MPDLRFNAFLLLVCWPAWIGAQDPVRTPPPIREVSPGLFAVGAVKFDKAQRTVQFPAVLNMENSIVEYLLVTEAGKIHESVLRTTTEASHIQLALLLLGAKGAGTNDFFEVKPAAIPGEKIGLEVSWDAGQGPKKVPAEQLVWDRRAQRPMAKGPWVYTGSRVIEGTFLAEQEGSLISLIVDPVALVNNPRPEADDDESWLVNTNGLPPLNWPVEVTIRLMPQHKEEQQRKK